jgi:hypothetical protein
MALPPTSFIAVTSLDHQYLPGASDEFVLTGVAATDFATMFGTVQFSGDSAGNPYNATGGE